MNYLVSNQYRTVNGTIHLPASKSISNRVLIINALSEKPNLVSNLSDSDDTRILRGILSSKQNLLDAGHAGTAMRFLTAFFSATKGEWELTGSPRMKQRPIGILVEALKDLGGKIEYIEKEGFPPLKIYGSELKGKTIEMNGSVSSQYISALLMIAPVIKNGLIIKIKGELASESYIKLTLDLMAKFGIKYKRTGNTISVPEQKYMAVDLKVEADWSAASYWYEILALAEKGEIILKNLNLDSVQGDSELANWFIQFGINSLQQGDDVVIKKSKKVSKPEKLQLDLINNPDLAQTMTCLCVTEGVPFQFSGLKTLKIKETDRINALIKELAKLGAQLKEVKYGELQWEGKKHLPVKENTPVINTYKDHRMALSFAPLAIAGKDIIIEDPMVVTKSYPGFWQDLKQAGFLVKTEESSK